MRCRHVRGFLSAYLDDQTTSGEAEFVEAHLRVCSSCRRELEQLRQMVGLLGELEAREVPQGFTEELHTRLLRDQVDTIPVRERVFRPQKPGWLIPVVAAVALLIGFFASNVLPCQHLAATVSKMFSPNKNSRPSIEGLVAEKAWEQNLRNLQKASTSPGDTGDPQNIARSAKKNTSIKPDKNNPNKQVGLIMETQKNSEPSTSSLGAGEIISGHLEVNNAEEAVSELIKLASDTGGSCAVSVGEGEKIQSVTLKVPLAEREAVFSCIQALGNYSSPALAQEELTSSDNPAGKAPGQGDGEKDTVAARTEVGLTAEEKKEGDTGPVEKDTSRVEIKVQVVMSDND